LTASTSKKVLISRFDRETVAGFVSPQSYLQAGGMEVVTRSSVHTVIPYSEIKAVYFVRDFDEGESSRERRLFSTRPRMEGLWVRMTFRDGEIMDGLLPNNLLAEDACGFTVTPPDPASRGQRIFVPRAALREIAVLGVVGSPLRRQKPKPEVVEQIKLFE
jgi:hypothetical protein